MEIIVSEWQHIHAAPSSSSLLLFTQNRHLGGDFVYTEIMAEDRKKIAIETNRQVLEHNQFDGLVGLYSAVSDVLGVRDLQKRQKDFSLYSFVTYIPPFFKVENILTLKERVSEYLGGSNYSPEVIDSVNDVVDELLRRNAWVHALLDEVKQSNPKSEGEFARRAYYLVAGENPFESNKIRIVITPVSIHFLCSESRDQARLMTSGERTERDQGGDPIKIIPLTDVVQDSWYRKQWAGVAGADVFRKGGRGVVSSGRVPWNLVVGDAEDVFKTFRHETDHLIFSLFEKVLDGIDKKYISRMWKNIVHKVETVSTAELSSCRESILDSLVSVWMYARKKTRITSDEFLAQYGDGGAAHARASLLSDAYVSHHFPDGVWEPAKGAVAALLEKLCEHDKDKLQVFNYRYDYGARVRDIRTNWINQAEAACNILERTGLSRFEVQEKLRLIPLPHWGGFARRESRKRKK